MPQFEFICLANSFKHGGRCVAGLRTDGLGWIRPVSSKADGTLDINDYVLDDLTEIGLLDVARIGTVKSRAQVHQPENWQIDANRWALVSRPKPASLAPILDAALLRNGELILGCDDRVSTAELHRSAAAQSLALVAPPEIRLHQRTKADRSQKLRCHFTLDLGARCIDYDLALTDPIWVSRTQSNQAMTFRNPMDRVLLAISLGEPFGGYCYKIVAAIIQLPVCVPLRI